MHPLLLGREWQQAQGRARAAGIARPGYFLRGAYPAQQHLLPLTSLAWQAAGGRGVLLNGQHSGQPPSWPIWACWPWSIYISKWLIICYNTVLFPLLLQVKSRMYQGRTLFLSFTLSCFGFSGFSEWACYNFKYIINSIPMLYLHLITKNQLLWEFKKSAKQS